MPTALTPTLDKRTTLYTRGAVSQRLGRLCNAVVIDFASPLRHFLGALPLNIQNEALHSLLQR